MSFALRIAVASLVLMVTLTPYARAEAPTLRDLPWIARAEHGMVATDNAHASRAGLSMLVAGGNAVDAAVATSFALAVTRPYSTGLGGGGFTILRLAGGQVIVQDARETAPALATPDMFSDAQDDHTSPPPSRFGARAVATPGLLRGRCEMLAKHGTLPLATVMAPAIKLAEDGFALDEHFVDTIESTQKKYDKYPVLKSRCAYVYKTYLASGKKRNIGDLQRQPKLARLLRAIAEGGPEVFYSGPIRDAIVKTITDDGGILSPQDLSGYTVKYRKPLTWSFGDYEIISMPTPSSGGIALAESLNILEALSYDRVAASDPALSLHYRIEAMKHAFADRARWLGDADFADVPVERLTSQRHARILGKRIEAERTVAIDNYGIDQLPDDSGTSHFCVVDRRGNALVSTETINTSFGSLLAVDEWGLILNDEMDDFSANPGKQNAYGLMQSDRNAIGPLHRPLSSMSPTMLIKDDQPFLLLGASGGPRIITAVLNVILDVTMHGRSLESSFERPRPHHQWLPNEIYFDRDPPPGIAQGLIQRGHKISSKHREGIVQAIMRTKSGWIGSSDPRKGGRPAGH